MSFTDIEFKGVDHHRNSLSITATTLFFYGFTTIFAGLTILTHFSQILHISFKSYFLAALSICFAIAVFWLLISKKWLARAGARDVKALLLLVGIGLTGSLIALIAHRPSIDDYYYIPNAVFYIQNPNALMGFKIHYLFSEHVPFESFTWATSNAYEYIQACIAFGLRVDFLSVYYILFPALIGFMIPVALFLAIVHFSDNTLSAVIGTFFTVGVTLVMGETPRTFGGFFLDHIFQGKAVLLSLGIPLFVAFSINYFTKPAILSWLGLFFVATTFTSMSSSTIFILPALSVVLMVAYLVTVRNYKITSILGYFGSLVYVVAFALYTFIFWRASIGNYSPANQGWPTTFFGHAEFFIAPQIPLTPILLIGSTVVSLLLLSGKRRRFLVGWMIASIGIFLNPITSIILIEYLTSVNAYWRMFYIYPFPLMIGVITSTLFFRTNGFFTANRFALVLLGAILLIGAVCFSPTSVFSRSSMRIDWPTYKLPINAIEQAKSITEIAPPGAMLAPIHVGARVVMIDSRFPQLRIREDAELVWLSLNNLSDEGNLRIVASDYLNGDNKKLASLQRILSIYNGPIRSVIIKNSVLENNSAIVRLFTAHKFLHRQSVDEYVVFWK